MGCKKNCFTYCPRDCCGVAGKRDKVLSNEGSGKEETADNGSAREEVKQNVEEKHDVSAKSAGDNAMDREQTTSDVSQEGSSESNGKVRTVENDDWKKHYREALDDLRTEHLPKGCSMGKSHSTMTDFFMV